ncbi:MAG: branched-chain amino acid ABC transporter permease [Ruminococcaceae bacterium]|nr:branched-chain amino acid ABC transporter permease [Oscillospiraceae bacterium]
MKNKKFLLISLILAAVCIAGVLVVNSTMRYSMLASVLQKGAIYALVAVALNLLNGFTGLFSLGQAGFMMLGAYTYAILTIPVESRAAVYQYFDGGIIQFCLPMAVALVLAGIVPMLFAWLIGLPVLKLKSDYLAIATLGFAEIMRALIQWKNLGPVTNGSNLLRNFANYSNILFPIVLSAVCIGIIVLLINSTYGRAFKAIRDDEVAAEAMGINLAKHKMIAFMTSAFFAGIGGALLAMFQSSVQANAFTSAMTYEILLIVVIGGIGSVSGSVIGSFLFVACSEWWLRFLDDPMPYLGFSVPFMKGGFRMLVFSVVIMIVVLFFRKGIMGDEELPAKLRKLSARLKNRPAKASKKEVTK